LFLVQSVLLVRSGRFCQDDGLVFDFSTVYLFFFHPFFCCLELVDSFPYPLKTLKRSSSRDLVVIAGEELIPHEELDSSGMYSLPEEVPDLGDELLAHALGFVSLSPFRRGPSPP
jgi:hypothetical protein